MRSEGRTRFLLVVPTSRKALRDGVVRLGRALNREMHYDFGIYDGYGEEQHVLMAVIGAQPAGMLILERRTELFEGRWRPPGEVLDEDGWGIPSRWRGPLITTHAHHWTVGFVGVSGECRRSGVATALVGVARECLKVPMRDLAWYVPFSEAGEALVRHLYGGRSFLVG